MNIEHFGTHVRSLNYVWSVTLLEAVLETQPGGGTGGAGDASASNQVLGNASLASIDGKLPALSGGRIPVVLPAGGSGLTDTELRATPVPVSGAFFQTTQPVSLAVAPTTPVTGTFWQAAQPVTGTFWQAIQPVNGTVTVGALPAAGALGHTTSSTAANTNVSASATSVQLLALTAGRRMATIHNDSTAVLFVKYGTTASATSYTVKIPAGGYFEFPHPVYTGRVDGIWDAANGAARITELT